MVANGIQGVVPMISVVIATHDSERPLVPTLAALVPAAMAGVVREVIVADGGSHDGTAKVADVAGCRFVVSPEASLGARLKASAACARAPWLLFLKPGSVPDATWTDEANRFMQDVELGSNEGSVAAVFRRAAAMGSRRPVFVEALALLAAAVGARPSADQGLLISKHLYQRLGGHHADIADPEADLLHRLGRRRIVLLRCGVVQAG